MKSFLIALVLLVSAASAQATPWTCEAYCNVDGGAQGSILLVAQGNSPLQAFDRLTKECGELNYPYTQDFTGLGALFSTTGEHHEEATVVNSCKMFDLAI